MGAAHATLLAYELACCRWAAAEHTNDAVPKPEFPDVLHSMLYICHWRPDYLADSEHLHPSLYTFKSYCAVATCTDRSALCSRAQLNHVCSR